jgi:hypothetical protein
VVAVVLTSCKVPSAIEFMPAKYHASDGPSAPTMGMNPPKSVGGAIQTKASVCGA